MKRTISMFCAWVMSTMMLGALPVSAATHAHDLNGDGSVNALDALFLNNYLAGRTDVTNVSALDLTADGMVDYLDAQFLNSRLLGGSFEVNATDLVDPMMYNETTSQTRQYYKYLCDSNMNPSSPMSYNLTQSVINNGEVSTNAVSLFPEENTTYGSPMLEDNRIPVTSGFENGIVKVVTDEGYFGTGFIVGDNVIATAAHTVYDLNEERFYEVDVLLFNGNVQMVSRIHADEIHIPKAFNNGYVNGNQNYDYALIYVQTDLSNYSQFDLGTVIQTLGVSDSFQMKTMGFPEEFDVDGNGSGNTVNSSTVHAAYTSTGTLETIHNFVINHDVCITDGQSGSPLYRKTAYTLNNVTKQQLTALSIAIRQNTISNTTSLRITGPVIQFYLNNSNIG